ncbi:MAG: Txe/YoeB family addiction module toxin [Panacagrimonas sp.]
MPIEFADEAWQDDLYWQKNDRAILRRINHLLREVECSPFSGIGKPEPLKHHLGGYWSRRIDDTHRHVYRFQDQAVSVAQCRYHY